MLVGRDRELADIGKALADAAAGHGRLVLVSGAAGIGKSRLAGAAAELAAARGFDVARSYAIDDPGAPPLWPWTRLIRGWPGADALPQAPREPDAAARFTLFVAISDVLFDRANAQPLLVILEDLHWADPSSHDLLRHVAAGLVSVPLCLLVTYRDAPPVPALAEVAGRDGARPVAVSPLTCDEIAAWLPDLIGRSDPALAAALHESTGGVALLVRLAAQDLTESDDADAHRPALRAFASARLAALDPATRGVVEAAAVLGEHVDPDVLRAVAGVESVAAPLAAAVRAGVLRDGPEGIAFEHALVRDAVYAQAPGIADLHRRTASVLAADSRVPAGVVASHWERGGDTAECFVWARRADDDARAALGYDEALRFAELAVRCAPDSERPEALVRLAEAQFLAGALDASVDTCRRAADVASAAGRPDLVARAGLVIVGVGNPGLNRTVAEICERALRELPADERALRARLLAQVAVGVAETEGGPRPAELAAAALAEADASGDPQAIIEAIAARHLAISVPHTVTERLELGRRAIEVGAAQARTMPALWGHLWRADGALQLGNLAEFDHELAEIDRVARTRKSFVARWHHHRWSAARALLLGNFTAGRAHDAAAFAIAQQIGEQSFLGMTFAFRSELAILRGRPDDDVQDWEAVLGDLPAMPLVRVSLPIQLALRGRQDEARVAFEPFRHLPEVFPVGVRWAATVGQIGRAAILLADGEVARTVHDLLLGIATYYSGDGSGGVFSNGSNSGLLGELALTAGDPARALDHFRVAEAMNVRIAARPFVALARLGIAQSLVALGADAAQSHRLRDEAAAEFRRLDMPGQLAAAERLTTTGSSPLTAREAEVAGLVAEALSNRQIADRLVLSERTVETHVRSILAKLGFATRTEIATWQLRTAR
jgi:DNA-binding CsgD family transcriptional regulator/tetratricopeptide (TPR) repeat protein